MSKLKKQSLFEKILSLAGKRNIDLTAKQARAIVDTYLSMPDMREEKAAFFKYLIETGQYDIDPDKLAEALLEKREDIADLLK